MTTFNEYQQAAIQTPVCPDGLELDMPAMGLQVESGKIGRIVAGATVSNFDPSPAQVAELRSRLGDMLWCMVVICDAAGTSLEQVAQENLAELENRSRIGPPT